MLTMQPIEYLCKFDAEFYVSTIPTCDEKFVEAQILECFQQPLNAADSYQWDDDIIQDLQPIADAFDGTVLWKATLSFQSTITSTETDTLSGSFASYEEEMLVEIIADDPQMDNRINIISVECVEAEETGRELL